MPPRTTAREIGNYGERVAGAFLRRNGYRVLYRNFLTDRGEIDLVCRCADVLVFVEVRSRAGIEFGRPGETIGEEKKEALLHAARRYLELLENREIFYRFDAVEVMLQAGKVPLCTLQRDIFAPSQSHSERQSAHKR